MREFDLHTVLVVQNRLPALAIGQVAILSARTGEIHAEATSFLSERYCRSGSSKSPETWRTVGYHLASWLDYTSAAKIEWRAADEEDLIEFTQTLANTVSRQTGTLYCRSTIENKESVIRAFYDYLRSTKQYAGDILNSTGSKGRSSRGAYVHTGRGRARLATRGSRASSSGRIRPFYPAELQRALAEAGPRASEVVAKASDLEKSGLLSASTACRNRLLFDLGWAVGLRVHEIHGLNRYQFLELIVDEEAMASSQIIYVAGKGSLGSGKKVRAVAVPNWLIADAQAYIEHLLPAAPAGRHTALFLSSQESNRPGRPISVRRLQQIVEETCCAANILRETEIIDLATHARSTVLVAAHSVHDLRHTYAVYTYLVESHKGNAEPWKKISSQLGHTLIDTTIKTYLKFIDILGPLEGVIQKTLFGINTYHEAC
jgi:integrase